MTAADLILAAFGIALGGFLKGATGAGAPVVGVPILALAFGVPKAVAIFSVLNLFSNTWQAWAYRGSLGRMRFVAAFAIAGALGAAAGSVLLASLSTDMLMGGLATVVFLYIGLRLARPDWQIGRARGEAIAGPVGFVAGLMQGAGGISAPVSVTFLNAMRLERSEFVATISVFFFMMSALQIPSLAALGVLTWDRAGLALVAAIPLFGAMPLGEMAARRVSKATFDKMILLLLVVVALRLGYSALT
ncbi:sulfite exporter TauE/SafE family protein [Ovoidimarina sediminis]|uniref:sulfite exporter TauE/SafE family protein n=1 Tax=Ovoidimarina sediminis TaxID=3079856 RepID=UPI0029152E95|nr:sulfite exporter TauE/SafE family protein [Rhodophyticola sp. MJ-SS7]MDU8944664.1 sulfite exporter TauE/SafE family protein [Rhodophyticola sp. MJ-SS7]